jgi:hypothetical protein
MSRGLAVWVGVGLLAGAALASGAAESFPDVHREAISIRVVDGKNGQPVAHAQLRLVAGYSQRDLHLEMWHGEVLTDDRGKARLPDELANLPLLEITVAKRHVCLGGSHVNGFSVERIRRDGLSTANACGTVTVEDAPGVFTVFVKSKSAAAAPAAAKKP